MDEEHAERLLAEVLRIIESANVPDDLRPAAFEQLWVSLSGPAPAPTREEQERPAAAGALATLAQRLGTDAGDLQDLYEITEDGTLRLQAPTSKLPEPKAAAMKELALLVCAAREAVGETSTPAATIRAVCNEYGKLDSANFAAAMKEAEDHLVRGGSTRQRTYRLRRPGWEATAEVVKRLAGIV